jgi:GDP/UDP-N,N'-diacetylbacillosamine 2-epimerase (hydrolysing)
MKSIAVLTSSRADYGIYLPLLKMLESDSFFNLSIIAFGTHTSDLHGHTIDNIVNDGFKVSYQIESILAGDSADAISTTMALTSLKFSDFWRDHQNDFDLVFCLGDRYEMFAAVIAGIPFQIQFAHIHGGEKTLGAIDNVFRHSITLSSKFHFVSCNEHADRVAELIESGNNIFNVGSLSLDNFSSRPLLSKKAFFDLFGVDLSLPTILVTFHPETVSFQNNEKYADEISNALGELTGYNVLITLPNADGGNSVLRKKFLLLSAKFPDRIFCKENLGSQGYFTAMTYCSFMLGNTSSGIIEAASFGKMVINLGNRQDGRIQSQNIYNLPVDKELILQTVKEIEKNPEFKGENIYYKENPAGNICMILKKLL